MLFRELKQEMDQVFTRIKQDSTEGTLPALDDVKRFAQLCFRMQSQAPESWELEADDFQHLAKELLQSVKKQNIQEAVFLISSLQEAQTYCHRTFGSSEGPDWQS
ncbi:MAG: GAK system XXXCH domain-containing protein [Desulfohalobiaceae bacterium]